MKVNSLQRQEKSILADFFESPEYKSLRTVMAQLQTEWERQAVNVPTMEDLRELRGKISGLREFDELLKKNHKKNLPNQTSS